MKNTVFASWTLIFLCFSISPICAQESWIDTSLHRGLIALKTDYPFQVLVSTDTIANTDETLQKLNKAKQYFDQLFNIDLDFAVLFVENHQWQKHSYFPPPGLPQAGRGNVILGLEKSVVAQQVESMLSKLPEPHTASLKQVYGQPMDLDLFYRETLSVHELAHLYHFKYATQPQRKWLQELFATMCMYSFIKEKAKSSYELMDTYPEFALRAGDKMAEFKTLKDFEEKYVQELTPPNYEWFQMQFYKYAKSILNSDKPELIRKLRTFLINTDLSKTELISDEELKVRLNKEVGKEIADIASLWPYQ